MDLVLPFGIAFKEDTDLSHKVAAYNFFFTKDSQEFSTLDG